jgi:hypothetical protein
MQCIHTFSLDCRREDMYTLLEDTYSLPFMSFDFNTVSLNIKVIINVRRPYIRSNYLWYFVHMLAL